MKQGVWLVQPLKAWVIILHKSVKMTLNIRINMFKCILYHCTETFVFLEVARRGMGYSPPSPPNFATELIPGIGDFLLSSFLLHVYKPIDN